MFVGFLLRLYMAYTPDMTNTKYPWSKVNPFFPNALFLYPLKISENLTVFWCFQGVEKVCIGNEWVNYSGSTHTYITGKFFI